MAGLSVEEREREKTGITCPSHECVGRPGEQEKERKKNEERKKKNWDY